MAEELRLTFRSTIRIPDDACASPFTQARFDALTPEQRAAEREAHRKAIFTRDPLTGAKAYASYEDYCND